MKHLRSIGISLVAAASVAVFAAPSMAQTSLDDVLRAAKEERQAVARENKQREAEFVQERNTQQSKLRNVKAKVAAAEATSDRLQLEFDSNGEEIAALTAELQEKQGSFAELFGAARAAAKDLSVVLEGSVISGQYPGRVEVLEELAESETLPSIDQLEGYMITALQEMVEQSKVTTFTTDIAQADGSQASTEVTRIGPFSAFTKDGFVRMQDGSLKSLGRQPGAEFVGAAKDVIGYSGDGVTKGPIDPTLGTLLGLAVQKPTLKETFDQGGPVGKVIAAIAVIGVIIGVFKLITLWGTSGAVRSQVRKKTAGKGNPLGRVMMAYQSNTSADVETLQLKLDDAVLREMPKLDSGLNLLKVLAAVAPLLGLLGTVIGMINTFQAITLFGTGDPQIMAGGISEALVTTVMGLIAAIPLLLLHAFASGASRSVSQILEEQSAGMIAEHAEARS